MQKRAHLSSVDAHQLWSETDGRINTLTRSVKEGRGVDEASNFSRWLRFSGVIQILEMHEQGFPLPVRAEELKRKTNDLINACGEWYQMHERANVKRDCYISSSALDDINGQLLELRSAMRQITGVNKTPALEVLKAQG
ncbi:MAG: hypothetical protein ACTHLW_01095 [Verrucomicrobiota bacterium]